MGNEQLGWLLLRCAAINYAVLIVWFGAYLFAHDWVFRLHARWFQLSPGAFDAINYAAIAAYKIGNILFFLVPAIVLLWGPAAPDPR
jgi:hypothetical protein